MKERITGIISFLGAIGWGIVILWDEVIQGDGKVLFVLTVLLAISIVLYVVWTKFGKMDHTEIEKIELANELLKKQIEHQELKKKLEDKKKKD